MKPGTTIWSPLASGILSGKYAKGVPADSRMALPEYKWLRDELESAEGVDGGHPVRGAAVVQLSGWCVAPFDDDAVDVVRPRGTFDLQIEVEGIAPGEEAFMTVAAVPSGRRTDWPSGSAGFDIGVT